MQYRPIGDTGVLASVIALGTWAIGGWKWGGTDDKASIRAIHTAIDHGINFVDTAPVYGMGRSESIVGKAIRDRRDEVVIATKCGLHWEGLPGGRGVYFFTDDEGREIIRSNHPEDIRREIDRSLQRLGVDCIDLYQTHWQDPSVPIEDTMGTLIELRDAGKIRAIGACNASLDQLRQYCACGPLAADQELFNMLDQKIRGHHLTFTREQNLALLSYSSLALGLLTGKVTPDREFPPGDLRHDNPRFTVENRIKINRLLEQIQPVADHYDLTLAQFALCWTACVHGVTHVLNGVRSETQAVENARAGEVTLSTEHFKTVDNLIRQAGLDLPYAATRKKKGSE